MRWPARLIVVGIAAVTGAGLTVHGSAQNLPPGALAPSGADNQYAGSAACQRCHEDEYDSWRQTLHVQMTKPIGQARVEGDFRPGTHLEMNGRAYTMQKRGDGYFISVANGGNPATTFEINYTLGARRFQGYLSKLPDGRIYVLPVFWHSETRRWIDWKEITPIPDDPSHDLRQIWNVTCVNCHATNLVKNFDATTKTYATTWTEMGIGCEACHGPGQAHMALMDQWAKDPSAKPTYDNSATNRQLGPLLRIFSPRTASPRQVFDACGYCHGNKNNVFFGFKPGDRYEDYALPFLMSEPIPANDPQGDFWPDGRPSRFNRPQALMLSECFQKGQATCTSCHRAHGSQNDHMLKVPVEAPGGGHTKQSDLLCTQCHSVGTGAAGRAGGTPGSESSAEGSTNESARKSASAETTGRGAAPAAPVTFADLSAHTHHAPDSSGSRCVECHMSDVNWRLFTRRRDHTFQPPVPEMTSRYGVPNACTTCHEDKTPEWAGSTMDAWYGNGDRRRAVVATADVMYRAGTGDASVLTDVARLAVDRSHGAAIRASAAEFAGQLIAKGGTAPAGATAGAARDFGPATLDSAITNALIGATADREPLVRITAIRALAMTHEPRVASVLAAHLTDEARLVRVSAAEGLMGLGIITLDGAAGQALARAQDEWAVALATFNDDAADHASLGWLLAERGRAEDATKELNTAVSLDPTDPRPHVFLGVLAARAGHYDEALQNFETAKKIDPAYQNLDRLIDEAEKRIHGRD